MVRPRQRCHRGPAKVCGADISGCGTGTALQAEYEAGSGVCPPQAAATAGSDSVELSRTPTAVRHSFHLCQSLTLSLHLQGQEQGHCQEQQKGLSYAPGQEHLV